MQFNWKNILESLILSALFLFVGIWASWFLGKTVELAWQYPNISIPIGVFFWMGLGWFLASSPTHCSKRN